MANPNSPPPLSLHLLGALLCLIVGHKLCSVPPATTSSVHHPQACLWPQGLSLATSNPIPPLPLSLRLPNALVRLIVGYILCPVPPATTNSIHRPQAHLQPQGLSPATANPNPPPPFSLRLPGASVRLIVGYILRLVPLATTSFVHKSNFSPNPPPPPSPQARLQPQGLSLATANPIPPPPPQALTLGALLCLIAAPPSSDASHRYILRPRLTLHFHDKALSSSSSLATPLQQPVSSPFK